MKALVLPEIGSLVCKTFEVPEELRQKTSTHHIWIMDVSGSMWSHIANLAEDVVAKVKELPIGDTITLGWFSGRGQYSIFLTGYTIAGPDSYAGLERVVRENLHTRGWTCFSEILNAVSPVVDTLHSLAPTFTFELMFFTDGYPTVQPYEKEIRDVFNAINSLKGRLATALLVGYGDGFNRELMGEMTSAFSGSLVCSRDLAEFSKTFTSYLSDVSGIGRRIEVDSPVANPDLAFLINGSSIMMLEVANGKVSVPVSNGESQTIYCLSFGNQTGFAGLPLIENADAAVYAAALLLNQKCKTQEALKLLSYVGDVHLIDKLRNAFTNDEYSEAEAAIREAVGSDSSRYKNGKVAGYLPKDDAFCLLDAVDTIMADDTAMFLPMNSYFSYKRVGAASKKKEGVTTEFAADPDASCRFSGLVWNSSKLNLSVYTQIQGTVDLPSEASKLGLATNYPCFVHRNYTLVSDGKPNVSCLPMRISEATHKILSEAGMVKTRWEGSDKTYLVNLGSVPVINFNIAKAKYSAKELCQLMYRDMEISGILKALKFYLKETEAQIEKAAEGQALTRSEAQTKFLLENFIDEDGAYNPPTEAVAPTDVVHVNTFEIKMKGLSSLPSINAVTAKVKEGKKLTASDQMVQAGILEANKNPDSGLESRVSWFESRIKEYSSEQKAIRKKVQKTKFAIILGKTWFEDTPVRKDETTVILDNGTVCTLVLGKEEVHI